MNREDLIDAIPSKVKILHRDWKIVEKSMTDFAIDHRLGSASFVNAEIEFVDNGGTDPVDTLLHELIHVLYSAFDLGGGTEEVAAEEEEHLVSTLATGIVTLMRDNPTLFPVLQAIVDAPD